MMTQAICKGDNKSLTAPLPANLKAVFQDTARLLKGSDRRMFMAKTARLFGPHGHRQAERELGWNRKTLRKGEYELQHGPIQDQFSACGRKGVDTRLPNLDRDIRRIVQPESQTDPIFRTLRQYRRITAPSVRKQLLEDYGYTDEELPSIRTILTKLNQLDYRPRKVVKSKPKKKDSSNGCHLPATSSTESVCR
jgi:hypothetical protein